MTYEPAYQALDRKARFDVLLPEERSKVVPMELDRIADVVMHYRPKPKSKSAKKRARKAAKKAKG